MASMRSKHSRHVKKRLNVWGRVHVQQVPHDELHELPDEPRPLLRWMLVPANNVRQVVDAVVEQLDHLVREHVFSVQYPQLQGPSVACRIRLPRRHHLQASDYPLIDREHELVVVIVHEVLEEPDGDANGVDIQLLACHCCCPAQHCTLRRKPRLVGPTHDQNEEVTDADP